MAEAPEELTTWKEIAERLQVTVRTAQEWEKKRGLPVRRIPGSGRGRVFMKVAELEAWLDGQLPDAGDGDGWSGMLTTSLPKPQTRRALELWRGVAVGSLLIAVGAWAAWHLLRPARRPAGYRVLRDAVVILDEGGDELWRARFEGGLDQDAYDAAPNQVIFVDTDADGRLETLFVLRPADDKTLSHTLICFGPEGQERWRFTPGRPIESGGEVFENIYHVGVFRPFDLADGTKGIVVTGIHHLYYPTQVVVLSAADGTVRTEYWHSGQIGATELQLSVSDLDADGNSELYLVGVSNSRDRATLIVLDPEEMTGASSEPAAYYQLQGFPEPVEIARVLFRRTAMNLIENRYNVAINIWVTDEFVTVGVLERIHDPTGPAVIYHLRPDFTLDHFSFGSSFPSTHARLMQEGLITMTLEEQEGALNGVDYVGAPQSVAPAR